MEDSTQSQAAAQAIRAQLATVIDPELGENIVELGMVGSVEVDDRGAARVEVALTTPSCPLRAQIEGDVRGAVLAVDGVSSLEIVVRSMDREEKAALMDRARRSAQDEAPATSIPAGARVLGISSGKGGVGKSSVTVNLAVSVLPPATVSLE